MDTDEIFAQMWGELHENARNAPLDRALCGRLELQPEREYMPGIHREPKPGHVQAPGTRHERDTRYMFMGSKKVKVRGFRRFS